MGDARLVLVILVEMSIRSHKVNALWSCHRLDVICDYLPKSLSINIGKQMISGFYIRRIPFGFGRHPDIAR
jgi:hypothetical protein